MAAGFKKKWADIINYFLKENGKFIMAEFHPVVWMFDDEFTKVTYDYFNEKPIIETYEGTYADQSADIKQKYIMWNHSLEEVIQNLIKNGIELQDFHEYDWSPYPCFKHVEEFEKGKWRIPQFGNKIPLVYSLKAQKKPSY